MNSNLTKEDIKILKILSRNNDLRFQQLINGRKEHIKQIIEAYYRRKPINDELNKKGIKIVDFEDMMFPEFNEKMYEKSIPVLLKWLKNDSLSYDVKAYIISVLIQRPISKMYAFDSIIKIYKTADQNYINEWGYKTDLPVALGNAFLRWTDDDHANIIFDLLKEKDHREDGFLLHSISNFKKPENVKKAIKLLAEELKKPNLPNSRLTTIIWALRKLNAVETRKLVEPFVNFPKNYKRTIEIDPKKYGYTSDAEVRSEAKKTIVKLNKSTN